MCNCHKFKKMPMYRSMRRRAPVRRRVYARATTRSRATLRRPVLRRTRPLLRRRRYRELNKSIVNYLYVLFTFRSVRLLLFK